MRYIKVCNYKHGNISLLTRKLEINPDEIPTLILSGKEYIYVETSKGTLLISNKGELEITLYNIDDNTIICHSKKSKIKETVF